jgi:hypothetical protein
MVAFMAAPELSDRDRGIVVGLLVTQGSFGGDGRQPQISLKLHTRHEPLLRWLEACFPRTRVYGPYSHGGRDFVQWMARGRALVEDVLPVLDEAGLAQLDPFAAERLATMRERYADFIARVGRRGAV